jgi:hypothetical protein
VTSSMFIGVFAIVVKRAFFAWEAAVLPLNYARKLLILFYNFYPPFRFTLSGPCQLWARRDLIPGF